MKHGLSLTFVALMTLTLPTVGQAECSTKARTAKAWTALGRLPAERIVVYDPVSNSFAFVIDDRCTDATDLKNREILDRHRLALTTQKIRLLIMPYNPVGTTLQLEVKRDSNGGTEFEEMPGAKVPKANDTAEAKAPASGPAPAETQQVIPPKTLEKAKKTTAGKAQATNSKFSTQLNALGMRVESLAPETPDKQPDLRLEVLTKAQ